MCERPASWKKLSAISQGSAMQGTMAVKMERSYHLDDEDETEVEMENVVKGERSGGSLVSRILLLKDLLLGCYCSVDNTCRSVLSVHIWISESVVKSERIRSGQVFM